MPETWTLRDILIIGGILFNAGGLVYLFMNHMRHVQRKLDEYGRRLITVERGVAWIIGKLGGPVDTIE